MCLICIIHLILTTTLIEALYYPCIKGETEAKKWLNNLPKARYRVEEDNPDSLKAMSSATAHHPRTQFVKGYSKPSGDTQKHLLLKLSCTNKSQYSKKASTYTSLYLTHGFLSW